MNCGNSILLLAVQIGIQSSTIEIGLSQNIMP